MLNLKIDYNSPIRKLPIILNHRQAFLLDGIRVSLEMIEANSLLLESIITYFSTLNDNSIKNPKTAELFSSAWAIMDNTSRLNRLIKSLGFPIVDEETQTQFDEIQKIRNTFQHVDERIDEFFVENGGALLGYLSWIYIHDYDNIRSFTIKSGIDNKNSPTSNLWYELPKDDFGIHFLTLNSFKKAGNKYVNSTIEINKLIIRLNKIVNSLENLLRNNIIDFKKEPTWNDRTYNLGEVVQLNCSRNHNNTPHIDKVIIHDEFHIMHVEDVPPLSQTDQV